MPYKDKEKERERQRVYARRKKAHLTESRKEYMREYRAKNNEKLTAYAKEYKSLPDNSQRAKDSEKTERRKKQKSIWHTQNREKNADTLSAKNREWFKLNAEKVNVKRTVKYHNEPLFKLRSLLRSRLNLAIKNKSKQGSAVYLLGCTIGQAIDHIERQFTEGMTWSNWGKWHLDHIKPLASFDLEDVDQLTQACHYSNLQPLWAKENLSKGAWQEPVEDWKI